MQFLELISLRK